MIIYDPKMLVHDDVLDAWALDHLAEGKISSEKLVYDNILKGEI